MATILTGLSDAEAAHAAGLYNDSIAEHLLAVKCQICFHTSQASSQPQFLEGREGDKGQIWEQLLKLPRNYIRYP